MNLKSLNEIFVNRILRIPDYQRGFAWRVQDEIMDFWEDLEHLKIDKFHYTGLITLEPVEKEIARNWEDDIWLMRGPGYHPFYVVDGQQRLTTSIILIQAILDTVSDNISLSYQSLDEIKNKYVLRTSGDRQSKSYLFGYEKDDPSNEFLKTSIFGEHSYTNLHQQTLYTNNLEMAKEFFTEKLAKFQVTEIELLFEKLTKNLKFNLYEIDNKIDVCVAFETMNNRGKPLTNLELLKNRLIYLSTLIDDGIGGNNLRKNINNAWKTIYEYLGKNPKIPLSDDQYLRDHWTMYFTYSRSRANEYINFLLKEKFTAQNVTHPSAEDQQLTLNVIDDYVASLQQSIRPWFYIHNPHDQSLEDYGNENSRRLLDRLNRLNFGAFRPLTMAAYVKDCNTQAVNKFLEAVERYNFVLFKVSQRRANTGDSEFYRCAHDLYWSKDGLSDITTKINKWIAHYYNPQDLFHHIKDKYRYQRGFYDWNGLQYFLYEYEQYLLSKSKRNTGKVNWDRLLKQKRDHVTIEHIYPQDETDDYWQDLYKNFREQEKSYLTHSLGNLLPLSREKNSSLQNDSFALKKDNGEGVGYYNGSFSENEVNKLTDWRAQDIFDRGIELLNFMETRWDISIGEEQFKAELLHLDFLVH